MILNSCGHVILSVADDGSEVLLKKGEAVKVIRASERRGCLVVEHKNSTIHLPFQVMELKVRSFYLSFTSKCFAQSELQAREFRFSRARLRVCLSNSRATLLRVDPRNWRSEVQCGLLMLVGLVFVKDKFSL